MMARAVVLPNFQINCAKSHSLGENIQVILDEVKKLDLRTNGRISLNSKVLKYEADLILKVQEALQVVSDFYEEKKFYELNVRDNDKLMNAYYLPHLHKVLVKKPRSGQVMVEVKDQPTQYDSSDNLQDWSGQWSETDEE